MTIEIETHKEVSSLASKLRKYGKLVLIYSPIPPQEVPEGVEAHALDAREPKILEPTTGRNRNYIYWDWENCFYLPFTFLLRGKK